MRAGDRINPFSQGAIKAGDAAQIVGNEINGHPVPYIAPVGVMAHGLR